MKFLTLCPSFQSDAEMVAFYLGNGIKDTLGKHLSHLQGT